jgi:hypothetical protein
MNDREKSDPGIVAVKPTNKPGHPGAEPVEPRPGTKGNANRQSTLRTQSRAGVTQALERVRNAYGKPQSMGGRNGSPRSCTTSTLICSEQLSWRSSAGPPRAWMA